MPAEFLYDLTKNLTAHLQHKLCVMLPLRQHLVNIAVKRQFSVMPWAFVPRHNYEVDAVLNRKFLKGGCGINSASVL